MPISISNNTRVSNLLRTSMSQSAIQRTQAQLLKTQNELVTGRKINTPSDAANDASIAQQVRKTLEKRDAYLTNLQSGNNQLSAVDTELSSVTDLLNRAQTLASANVGSSSSQEERDGAAIEIQSILDAMMSSANKSQNGQYLFAGDRLTEKPFEEVGGGVQWVGSSTMLQNDYDEGTTLDFQVDGARVFGAMSTQVKGSGVLTPESSVNTRLSDLTGATNNGIARGTVRVSNGTDVADVDLTHADTLGDVIDALNDSGLGITASLNAAGDGIDLAGGAGSNISVTDLGGTMAGDLGIQSTAAGASVSGASTQAKLTELTPIAQMRGGAGLDLSGLTITSGTKTTHIDFNGATSVGDILNKINHSDANVQAKINEAGDGIDLFNTVQGVPMKIDENGGTTAAQLGLRSLSGSSLVSGLNDGRGVGTVDGTDLSFTNAAGVNFEVDLDGLDTMDDVIAAINTASTAAGADVVAAMSASSNGLQLVDNSSGPNTFAVTSTKFSTAAADLGLSAPATLNVIQGSDVNPIRSQGVFANLIALRDSLKSGDQTAITKAAEGLQGDHTRVVSMHGEVGARVREFESRADTLDTANLASKSILSNLEDADFTETVTQYQTLQTQLQATLQASSKTLSLSLMDFLS